MGNSHGNGHVSNQPAKLLGQVNEVRIYDPDQAVGVAFDFSNVPAKWREEFLGAACPGHLRSERVSPEPGKRPTSRHGQC